MNGSGELSRNLIHSNSYIRFWRIFHACLPTLNLARPAFSNDLTYLIQRHMED